MHSSFHLNTADYLIIATVVISGTVGLLRGLLREVIALITWIVAAFVVRAEQIAGLVERQSVGKAQAVGVSLDEVDALAGASDAPRDRPRSGAALPRRHDRCARPRARAAHDRAGGFR